ncbi:MAG: primase [Myxococcaceae bacterium]|nr:primase [Myxococcaceae bacterium]
MLTDDKLKEIRESVDLVALISEYVPLRRQGARFLGLCPFHSEKSPSFGVSRGKSFYYCFGCQASGDAITFLRHVEGLGFMEAVEKLAERSGIEVPHTDDLGQIALRKQRARRERLAELMAVAQAFYEEQLHSHPHADLARAELAKRKVEQQAAETFHLGYAPASWDALARHFTSKRIELEEAVEIGLLAQRNNGQGYYDRFRHRLMFPVADQHGRIIAFSGRALAPPEGTPADRDPPAKYINSPEGPLYKKGSALFGLYTARVAMRKHNYVLLCEGNFDLVAIHQAGFPQVLAPLGTAFTLDQAKLIRRFVEEVIVVFDGDGAGRKATGNAFELLHAAGLKGRAIRLPDRADPDSFLSEHGVEAFTSLVKNATPVLDFLIDEASLHVNDASDRARAIQELAPYLAKLEDPVEHSLYVERLAKKIGVSDRNSVRAALRRGALQNSVGQRQGGDARRPTDMGGQSLTSTPSPEKAAIRMRPVQELPQRQREALELVLTQPALVEEPEAQRLAELLTDSDLRAIFSTTARMFAQRRGIDAPTLLAELSSNGAQAWLVGRLEQGLGVSEIVLEQAKERLAAALPWLEQDFKKERRAEIRLEIEAAYKTGDQARAQELTRLREELART